MVSGESGANSGLGRPSSQPCASGTPSVANAASSAWVSMPSASSQASIRPVRQHARDEELPAVPPVVLVGDQGEPTGLLLHDAWTGEAYTAPVSLRVHQTTGISDALQRALTRSPAHRFDPVLCTDAHGDVVGLLRVEDLASAAPKAR